VVSLQRVVGNRAVTGLLTRGPVALQRQPKTSPPRQREVPPNTQVWEFEEPYRATAAMIRMTKIEATGWGEVGPAPPRITYRREVELQTLDGINFYLDIRGTVYLDPGTPLPTTPEAALQMRGRLVRSQRSIHVEGGDVVELREYSPHDVRGQSFGFVAGAVMPDYAKLPLSAEAQERAVVAFIAKLPRHPKAPAQADDSWGAVGVVADIGTDFLPIVGELKDLYRAVTGEDPVTGEKLAWWERALAFLGAIPLVGKLFKGLGKGVKFLGRGLSWLKGKGAALTAWFAEKLRQWAESRRANRLADEARRARQLAAAEREVQRLAEARRLARNLAPTLEEVQRLVPEGTDWMHWGINIFGQGPQQALDRIGRVTREQMLALGVNRDVAQALRNFYKSMDSIKGGATRVNRIQLLEHIIGLL